MLEVGAPSLSARTAQRMLSFVGRGVSDGSRPDHCGPPVGDGTVRSLEGPGLAKLGRSVIDSYRAFSCASHQVVQCVWLVAVGDKDRRLRSN